MHCKGISSDLVQQTALFRGLSDSAAARVAKRLRLVVVPCGESVIQAGGTDDSVFMVVSGTVKIKLNRPDGVEVVIAMLGPGEVVGELSAIDHGGRSADVVAMEETELLALSHTDLDEMLHQIPELAHNMLLVLARRVRMSTEQIQALCGLDVLGKVARQVLVFADLYGVPTDEGLLIPIRLTQSDLGGMVGASRERVNQVVGSLKHLKYISVDARYRVTVLQRDKLQRLVDTR